MGRLMRKIWWGTVAGRIRVVQRTYHPGAHEPTLSVKSGTLPAAVLNRPRKVWRIGGICSDRADRTISVVMRLPRSGSVTITTLW